MARSDLVRSSCARSASSTSRSTGRDVPRPSRFPRELWRCAWTRAGAHHARGDRRRPRARLCQGQGAADGGCRPRHRRPPAREHGHLQCLLRPGPGPGARRHRPDGHGEAPALIEWITPPRAGTQSGNSVKVTIAARRRPYEAFCAPGVSPGRQRRVPSTCLDAGSEEASSVRCRCRTSGASSRAAARTPTRAPSRRGRPAGGTRGIRYRGGVPREAARVAPPPAAPAAAAPLVDLSAIPGATEVPSRHRSQSGARDRWCETPNSS